MQPAKSQDLSRMQVAMFTASFAPNSKTGTFQIWIALLIEHLKRSTIELWLTVSTEAVTSA
jgi:hypothetical protein